MHKINTGIWYMRDFIDLKNRKLITKVFYSCFRTWLCCSFLLLLTYCCILDALSKWIELSSDESSDDSTDAFYAWCFLTGKCYVLNNNKRELTKKMWPDLYNQKRHILHSKCNKPLVICWLLVCIMESW